MLPTSTLMNMKIDELDRSVGNVAYKIGLFVYFVKLLKKELGNCLSKDEFSGLLCSGIVPFIIQWMQDEILSKKEQIDVEKLLHPPINEEQQQLYG